MLFMEMKAGADLASDAIFRSERSPCHYTARRIEMSVFTEYVTETPEVMPGGCETAESPPSRYVKEHTYCFLCARTYFYRLTERCPRCGSRSVQHYTSDELNLFRYS